MKRRKNAVYTGQSTRASASGKMRKIPVILRNFYVTLDENLLTKDEIEIIPPEQVKPAHRAPKQAYIMADYCIRKILPEVTGLYRWGDEITPQLRAVAPVVDADTVRAALRAAAAAVLHASAPAYAYAYDVYDAAHAALIAGNTAESAGNTADHPRSARSYAARVACAAARCVYYALVACIEADHEAAYNRIIALTNEMLESL